MKYKKKKKDNIWDWIYRTREEKIVKEIIFEEIIFKTWRNISIHIQEAKKIKYKKKKTKQNKPQLQTQCSQTAVN